VLALTATDKPVGRRRNNDALVFRVDYGAVSFLLASDIGAEAEDRLVTAHAPLAATVLKVAHHGARTSSTPAFLERVHPRLAVISVGRRNPYGHPAPDTVARLAAAGARIYRTDRDGAVIFETDGLVLNVTRWATREVERYCLDPDGGC
jgi:competence protein ComEC